MHQYVANRNVFRDCVKLFLPIIGFRKLSGRKYLILIVLINDAWLSGFGMLPTDHTVSWLTSTHLFTICV